MPHHQANLLWVGLFQVQHALGVGTVDSGEVEFFHPLRDGLGNGRISVFIESLYIEMGVGIDRFMRQK